MKTIIFDTNWIINKSYHVLLANNEDFDLSKVESYFPLIRKVFIDLSKILRNLNLSYQNEVWFSFDYNGSDFRKRIFTEYKGTRIPENSHFYRLIDEVFLLLQNSGQNVIRLRGVESDDLIAAFCKKRSEDEVYIITGDQDLQQLLDKNVFVVKPFQGKNTIFSHPQYTPSSIIIEDQVVVPTDPKLLLLQKVLLGDDSDNIPRIVKKGVGPKTIEKFYQKCLEPQNIPLSLLIENFTKEINYVVCEDVVEQQLLLIDLSNSPRIIQESGGEDIFEASFKEVRKVGECDIISKGRSMNFENFLKGTKYISNF